MEDTLDIGCGRSKTPGALGLDILPAPGVDVVHDLNKLPWPLEENRFQTIICSHVLEHLHDIVGVFNEIHRVGRAGARVKIITPHFSSLNSWEDPTHTHHFACRSFSFFDSQNTHAYTARRLRTLALTLSFGGGLWDFMGKVQYSCFPQFWEKHLCFLWRARNLSVELEVMK